MKGGFEHFRVPKVKRTKWKQKERNGSSGDQHSLKRTAKTTVQFSNYYFTVSTQQYELENELRIRNIDIADCVAEIEPTCVSALNKLSNFVFCVTVV